MHELSVIIHIADVIDDFAKENQIHKISAVTLQIGEVSGILYDYFEDCWNYFRKKKPILEEAQLKVEIIPAINYCTHCRRDYPAVPHGRICPYCGSPDTYLVQGNETIIKEVEVEDEGTAPETPVDEPSGLYGSADKPHGFRKAAGKISGSDEPEDNADRESPK